jgi:hypothetical protein
MGEGWDVGVAAGGAEATVGVARGGVFVGDGDGACSATVGTGVCPASPGVRVSPTGGEAVGGATHATRNATHSDIAASLALRASIKATGPVASWG